MNYPPCPKCSAEYISKNGVLNGKQRYKCRDCNYNFTVEKMGKRGKLNFDVLAYKI